MMDEVYRENRASFAILVILWAVVIVAIIFLPDTIPAHWGFDFTEPNHWGSNLNFSSDPRFLQSYVWLAWALRES